MLHLVVRSAAVLILLVLVAPFGWRLASGDAFLQVRSGSMEPTYLVGDVISVRSAEGDELTRLGEPVVVTFAGQEESQYVHRVVEVLEEGAWLQGDNNSRRDPQPVTQDRVVGTPRFVLGGVGADVFTWTQTLTGRAVLGGVALVLLFVPTQSRKDRRQAAGDGLPETRASRRERGR